MHAAVPASAVAALDVPSAHAHRRHPAGDPRAGGRARHRPPRPRLGHCRSHQGRARGARLADRRRSDPLYAGARPAARRGGGRRDPPRVERLGPIAPRRRTDRDRGGHGRGHGLAGGGGAIRRRGTRPSPGDAGGGGGERSVGGPGRRPDPPRDDSTPRSRSSGSPAGWATRRAQRGHPAGEAPVVVLLDTGVEPRGDLVASPRGALEDPTVAVCRPVRARVGRSASVRGRAGGGRRRGRHRGATRSRSDGPTSRPWAARRALRLLRNHWTSGGAWCSATRPRTSPTTRCRGVPSPVPACAGDTPDRRHGLPDDERIGSRRRSYYRVLKRFATRRDLLVGRVDRGRRPADGRSDDPRDIGGAP